MATRLIASFLTRSNDFQLLQAHDAEDAAKRAGLPIEVLFADNNPVEQIQQLFKFIHAPVNERPAAILVETVSGDGMERVARNALQAGIGWVLMNRRVSYLEELGTRYPGLPVCSVGTDQEVVGQIQGRQFKILLPNGGSILYIQGPPDTSAAQERLRGMQEVIEGSGIHVTVIDGRWTAESAEKAIQGWWRLKTSATVRLDLVGAQNDAMAMGAREALLAHPDEARRKEWGSVPFTGCDGLEDGGRRFVDNGALAATIIAPSNGGPAVELVARMLKGGPRPPLVNLLQPVAYPGDQELTRRRATR
jgi:ribose transport system substrate-binding protein